MNYKINYLILFTSIFLVSCIEEIDLVEFTDEFGAYEPELRVEALMLPHDNTAIIRIDRSISIDDESLFDCIDQNNNWVAAECVCKEEEETNLCPGEDECELIGGSWILYPIGDIYYYCDVTSIPESECSSGIYNLEWVLVNDCGADGICPDYSEDNEGYEHTPDEGEGNGTPDCGEENVDDIEEITEYSGSIHMQNCEEVRITYNDTQDCFFMYDSSAGLMYEGDGVIGLADGSGCESGDYIIDNIEDLDNLFYNYGAWVPNEDSCDVNFNNYEEGGYTLYIECEDDVIRSDGPEKIPYPVIFVESNSINNSDVGSCVGGDEHTKYSCLENYEINSTTFNLISDNDTNDLNSLIYVSTSEWYQAVQYSDPYYSCLFNPEAEPTWLYIHGHPAVAYPPTEETNHFPSYPSFPQIFTSEEVVVSDSPLSIGCYKYEIFTFSEAYINYYFYSQLNLTDPSRSNLRDSGGDVIIGAFGAMSGKTIQFSIIDE